MSKPKRTTLISLVVGILIIGFILGLNLWNFHARMERQVYDSDTLYHNFRVAAETKYGGYGSLPYAMRKEQKPVLVYFAYDSSEEEGCYEIYTLAKEQSGTLLWKGPAKKGTLTLEEGTKTVDIDIRKEGTYRITITVSEDGKSEIEIEQIS